MATTPWSDATKPRRMSKKTARQTAQRPIERVAHAAEDTNPVDDAIDRRFPERALRAQIKRITRQLKRALGPEHALWLKLETALNELNCRREDAYFDLGFEHGFAAGRGEALETQPKARDLSARLRDFAIQCTSEVALTAMLEAAQALAVRPGKRTRSPTR
jgi:hypothetical protein